MAMLRAVQTGREWPALLEAFHGHFTFWGNKHVQQKFNTDVCLTKILEHNSFNPGWDAHKKHCAWKDPSLYSSFIIALLPEDKYIQLKKHFRELYWLDLWEFHWKNDTFNRATSFLFKMLFMVFFSCNASQNLSLYGCSVCITLERPDRQFEPFSFLFSCYFGCAKWI